MFRVVLSKNLPSRRDGYYSVLYFKQINFFKIYYDPKKKYTILNRKNSIFFNQINKGKTRLVQTKHELQYLKMLFILINKSHKNKIDNIKNIFQTNFFSSLKFIPYFLSSFIFGTELLLFNKYHTNNLFGIKLLLNLIKNNSIYSIFIFLQIKMNHKNKNIRLITSETISTIKKKNSNILNPFLRCLFVFKKKWKIRFTICKTIQNFIKSYMYLSFYECEEFIFISERSLKDSKDIIKINGVKIFNILSNSSNKNSYSYLPCVILPVFDGLRKSKGNIFFIYLNAVKVFLRNYFFKIPHLLLTELINLILKFTRNGFLCNLTTIKILSLCFKKKFIDKNYINDKNFLFFFLSLDVVFPILNDRKIHAILNGLISFCKKKLIKKTLISIFFKFFIKGSYLINNILRLVKGLLCKYHRKKKVSFTLISTIFIWILSSIDSFYYKYTNHITLKLYHRILETIIKDFQIFLNYFFPQLLNTLKWELTIYKSTFRKQASITIRIIFNNINIIIIKKFIYELSVILFENLNEKRPNILSENILALNSLLKHLNHKEYIPPADILILELSSLLSNREKFISRNLSKCIWKILNRGYIFLTTNQWLNISLKMIRVAMNFDLVANKYCICSVYKIGKIIGPIKILILIIKEYNKNKKKYFFSHSNLFTLFLEIWGWQIAPHIFSCFFNKIGSIIEKIEIKTLMYIVWYLPKDKLKYYINLVYSFLEKKSELFNKIKSNSFYILVGLIAKKYKNKGFFKEKKKNFVAYLA